MTRNADVSRRRAGTLAGLAATVLLLLLPVGAEAEPATLGEALQELARNPTVEEVQRAALELAALDPERSRRVLARSRWSALLPRVEVTVSRGFARDEDLDREFQQMDELSLATDNDLDLRCTARWDLDRLVFDPEELRAARQASDDARRRRELLVAVTRLYFELVHLRALARLESSASAEERLERSLRISEVRALLDGLTGGLFSRAAGR